jgi:hypothetical protein
MTNNANVPASRGWLRLAIAGCVLVTIAMITVALVLFDKSHFGSLVGTWFLPVIASGVIVGGLLLFIAAWNLPVRTSWRGWVLMIWGLIAVTSPALGIMFLLPWALLAVSLPLVIRVLATISRSA